MEGMALWLLAEKESQEKQKTLNIIIKEEKLKKLKTSIFALN